MMLRTRLAPCAPGGVAVLTWLLCASLAGGDWPTFRADAARSASTLDAVDPVGPGPTLQLARPEIAWPDDPRLDFDRGPEPVVSAGLLVVGASRDGSVRAIRLEDGAEVWRVFCDGPVRFAPAIAAGRVHVVSDDGCLRTLALADGTLLWRVRGGPGGRLVLGNGRMISAWPARGAPVCDGDRVCFAASIWPFEGAFVHALDAASGAPRWTNDGDGARFLLQAHTSPAFSALAPQGYLAVAGRELLVANGRAAPARLDRETGALIDVRPHENARAEDHLVVATPGGYLSGGRVWHLEDGVARALDGVRVPRSVAVHDDEIAAAEIEMGADGTPRLRLSILRVGMGAVLDPEHLDVEFTDDARGLRYTARVDGARLVTIQRVDDLDADERADGGGSPLLLRGLVEHESKRRFLDGSDHPASVLRFRDRVRDLETPPKRAGAPTPEIEVVRSLVYRARADLSLAAELSTEVKGRETARVATTASIVGMESVRASQSEASRDAFESALLDAGARGVKRAYRVRLDHEIFVRLDALDALDPADASPGDSGARTPLRAQIARAGEDLWVAAAGRLLAFDAPPGGESAPRPRRSFPCAGVATSILVAADRVIVPLESGEIRTFVETRVSSGARDSRAPTAPPPAAAPPERDAPVLAKALEVLDPDPDGAGGFALLDGVGDELVAATLRASQLAIVLLESAERLDARRRAFDRLGLLGPRLTVLSRADSLDALPPYFASLVWHRRHAESPAVRGVLESLAPTLRPYGGVLLIEGDFVEHDNDASRVASEERLRALARDLGLRPEDIEDHPGARCFRRDGALAGAGVWTHQYGDASQSSVSLDDLVRAPLALLWFGGPSNQGVLPRHGHGPRPQVVGGRVFVEGLDGVRALDVYTGRLLWDQRLEGLGVAYDSTRHQPGANAMGANLVSSERCVLAARGAELLALDARDGRMLQRVRLDAHASTRDLSRVGTLFLERDVLVVATGEMDALSPEGFRESEFADWSGSRIAVALETLRARLGVDPGARGLLETRAGHLARVLDRLVRAPDLASQVAGSALAREASEALAPLRAFAAEIDTMKLPALARAQRRWLTLALSELRLPAPEAGAPGDLLATASRALVGLPVGLDHPTAPLGEPLWRVDAERAFRHNAVCLSAERVFAIDRWPQAVEDREARRGGSASPRVLRAFARRTGVPLWRRSEGITGTFLAYSRELDLLVEAGRASRDALDDEAADRLAVYRAASGELVWERPGIYSSPPIVWRDRVIVQGGAFLLASGEPVMRAHPVTGIEEPWSFSRHYGCASPVASRHLLTFRSATGGFFDLSNDGGTGNLGGFRPGCTQNLIAADGVLVAPDLTRTCVCSYPNQASIAFVHDARAEMWTFQPFRLEEGASVQSLAINLGAPGDRRDTASATYWFEHPSDGSPGPALPVEIEPQSARVFRAHSSRASGEGPPWVQASGIEGLERIRVRVRSSGTGEDLPLVHHDVTLHFADPDPDGSPRRIEIAISGVNERRVAELDPSHAYVGRTVYVPRAPVAGEWLEVRLASLDGRRPPVLNGLQLVARVPAGDSQRATSGREDRATGGETRRARETREP